jgi:two-component system, NtrC family, nitrogen regulation response regulator NtrX
MKSNSKKILIVDDDLEMGEILADILDYSGYKVQWIGSGAEALELIQKSNFNVILLDLLLPDVNGIDILKNIFQIKPETIVIMISGHGTIRNAIKAVRLGAYDWLEKPLEHERVLITIENALDKQTLLKQKTILLDEAKERYQMIGTSQALNDVYKLIDKVALANTNVLITGESGTGKELVARAIHINSKRAGSPFVQVNCAAVPETLIESELFGFVKGSFTGANKDRKGKFQQADGGTLFLDEIGDLSPQAQAKVLRAIESGDVEKVGSEGIERVDVRLISATNKDLNYMVSNGTFREDLFHRINVIEINVPPLRKRTDDIIPLTTYFLKFFCTQNSIKIKKLMPDAQAVLIHQNWHGNVRELRNFVEKMVVLIEDTKISSQHISLLLNTPKLEINTSEKKSLKDAKENFEKSFILQTLVSNKWNFVQSARKLNIDRSLLYKKVEKYNLKMSKKIDS